MQWYEINLYSLRPVHAIWRHLPGQREEDWLRKLRYRRLEMHKTCMHTTQTNDPDMGI